MKIQSNEKDGNRGSKSCLVHADTVKHWLRLGK